MDFLRDIELIALAGLSGFGVDYSGKPMCEAIDAFLTLEYKLIEEKPRTVLFSNKLLSSNFDEDIVRGLNILETKFKNGEDVNPHLGGRPFDPTYTDRLFADWGIQHFHLSDEAHRSDPRLLKRTNETLFAVLSDGEACFVDLKSHPDKNSNRYVYEDKELLQIIVDEWPTLLERFRNPGVIGLEFEINEPEQIAKMRGNENKKEGAVNVFHKINGFVYSPLGGGLTSAGTPAIVRRRANELHWLAKDLEKWVREERPQIDKELSGYDGYDPRSAQFRFAFDRERFWIYEERTKVAIYVGFREI